MRFIWFLSAGRSSLTLKLERDHAANGGGPDESIVAAGLVGPADDDDRIKVGLGGRRLRSCLAWFKGRCCIRRELREERCGGNGGEGGGTGMGIGQERGLEGGKVVRWDGEG